ncbi:MAG: hypothetical protein WED11_02145 [Natronospirillum sp.]
MAATKGNTAKQKLEHSRDDLDLGKLIGKTRSHAVRTRTAVSMMLGERVNSPRELRAEVGIERKAWEQA